MDNTGVFDDMKKITSQDHIFMVKHILNSSQGAMSAILVRMDASGVLNMWQ